MRIAVATDDGIHVAHHTGRCAGFLIFDDADGDVVQVESRRNDFTDHARGQCSGEGHGAAHAHHGHGSLLAALSDCQVLISRGMGPRLVKDLAANRISAVVCAEVDAAQAARRLVRGELVAAEGASCPNH